MTADSGRLLRLIVKANRLVAREQNRGAYAHYRYCDALARYYALCRAYDAIRIAA
jgi:hypothetical protein